MDDQNYNMCYVSLIVTTKKILMDDTQKKMKKKLKYAFTKYQQNTKGENNKGKVSKKPQKREQFTKC